MPVLPVPMIIALLLFGFFVFRLLTRQTHWTLLALVGVCGVLSVITAFVHYYGFAGIRPLQPVLAMVIPPVAWFAFSWAHGGEVGLRNMIWHVLGPLFAIGCLLTNPFALDALIPLSFTGYGLTILLRLRRGEDSLLHARLESGSGPLMAWRIVALSLIASAMGDVMIAYGLYAGFDAVLMWVPSVMSSLSLLSLGALSLLQATEGQRETETSEAVLTEEDAARDQAIITRLDSYMAAQKPFLDPDLTLARLARKLVVPAKQLSTAINRIKGVNVSKHINQLRIEEAGRLLLAGKPVTTTIFESGFNTKSNFNREFLRVMGKSPRDWLESARKAIG